NLCPRSYVAGSDQARAPVNMRMLSQPNPWANFFARGLQRATLQEPILGKPTEVLRRFKRIHIALHQVSSRRRSELGQTATKQARGIISPIGVNDYCLNRLAIVEHLGDVLPLGDVELQQIGGVKFGISSESDNDYVVCAFSGVVSEDILGSSPRISRGSPLSVRCFGFTDHGRALQTLFKQNGDGGNPCPAQTIYHSLHHRRAKHIHQGDGQSHKFFGGGWYGVPVGGVGVGAMAIGAMAIRPMSVRPMAIRGVAVCAVGRTRRGSTDDDYGSYIHASHLAPGNSRSFFTLKLIGPKITKDAPNNQ